MLEGLAEPVLRFAQYAVLLGLFGWSAFRLIGLRPTLRPGEVRRSVLAVLAAAAAPVVSAALMLLSISTMMGLPVTALDWPLIEAILLGTGMGYAFTVRAGLLVVGFAALLAFRHHGAGLILAAGCFACALITLGWSGHAAATEGGLGLLHRLNNGVHLLAAGLWLGAIGWFLALTVRSHRGQAQFREQALLEVMHRFAPLGITLVALVALTGMINSHLIFGLPNVTTALATPYGVLLAMKVVLVGAMLGCGAYNARTNRAHHKTPAKLETVNREQAIAALRRSLAGEFLLGIAVIGLVAVLGTMSPMIM